MPDLFKYKSECFGCEACAAACPQKAIVMESDEEGFASMVCFFELACAISGYMSQVNPFDQPGVEAYKKNMFRMLGKPGAV